MGKNKEMELAIKIAGKVDKSFNSAISTVNSSLRGMTKTLVIGSAAAAAAVGAITGKAVEVGKEFEASMSQVAATLQLDTASEEGAAAMATLEEAARQCGRETAFSASEAADGLNNLAMAGYGAEEAASALPAVLALAGAGAIEMGDSARYITASLASLGMDRTEENFNHLGDVMAVTAAKAKTDVSQIGEAITTLGGTGQGLKGGIDEITASLGVLANADITGSEGGTHLRNLILALQNPRNADAAEMFQNLGVNAYDAQGQMRGLNEIFGDLSTAMAGMTDEEKNATIATLFKQTDLAAARAMLQGCGEEYDNLYQAALNASDGVGAAQEMYNTQMDNLEGDTAILQSALSDVGISIYKDLQPGLRGATQFATELVSSFGENLAAGDLSGGIGAVFERLAAKAGELPDSFKQVAAAAAAIGGVNLVSSVLDSNLWKTGVSNAKQFGEVLKSAPTLAQNGLKNAGSTLSNLIPKGLQTKAGGVFSTIGGKVSGFASSAGSALSGVWDNLAGDSLLGKITGKLGGFLSGVGGIVKGVGGTLISSLGSITSVAMKMLMPAALLGGLLVAFGVLQSQFGDKIDGILETARTKGPGIIQGLMSGIASRIPALLAQGAQLVANLLNTIGALAPSIIMGGAQIIVELVNGVAQNAPVLIQGAMSAIGGFASGIMQALPMLLMAGMNLILALVQGISQNVPAIIQGAIGVLQTFGQGFLANLPMIIQTGIQIIAAIITGIGQAIGTLLGMIPEIGAQIIDGFMSVDWLSVGGDIIKGIGDGIFGGIGGVIDGIKGAVSGADTSSNTQASAPALPSTSTYTSAGQQGATAYASGFQSGLSQIESATQSVSSLFGEAGISGGYAFTDSLTSTLSGGFDMASAANIDQNGIVSMFSEAGTTGGETFTSALDMGLSGYSFDPSSIGLNMSGFSSELHEAATSGGDSFTSGLDSSLAGYSFNTSSIGIDTGALTSIMNQAGTEGGNAFTSALTASLGSGFDLAGAAHIDASGISATMSSAGQAGGAALISALQSTIGSGAGSIISAANSIGNGVNTAISSGFSRAQSTVRSAMSSIQSTCSSKARSAASAVKHAFEHMSIKIPKPKVPVISVSSASKTVGTQSVSYPKFSVSYHALGGIFNGATTWQDMLGNRHVMGEAGQEALLPLDTLWTKMESILRGILQGNTNTVDSLLHKLESAGGGSASMQPAYAGSAGGQSIYFSPTYNLYGSATREDAERAGRATFEEFKHFMVQYEKEQRRTRF